MKSTSKGALLFFSVVLVNLVCLFAFGLKDCTGKTCPAVEKEKGTGDSLAKTEEPDTFTTLFVLTSEASAGGKAAAKKEKEEKGKRYYDYVLKLTNRYHGSWAKLFTEIYDKAYKCEIQGIKFSPSDFLADTVKACEGKAAASAGTATSGGGAEAAAAVPSGYKKWRCVKVEGFYTLLESETEAAAERECDETYGNGYICGAGSQYYARIDFPKGATEIELGAEEERNMFVIRRYGDYVRFRGAAGLKAGTRGVLDARGGTAFFYVQPR